ncbi:RnfH family protein [Undibacterium sp. Ji22W]|uniref:RnfH family protein n=1 Tax=Undibacterium sp. Ji22W TaxID=3413038 RepID=UPI003BF222AD
MDNSQAQTKIIVEFCYTLPNIAPTLFKLQVNHQSTIEDALQYLASTQLSEVQFLLNMGSVWAIFGKKKSGTHLLQDGDRIELCRALIADPMSARRHRAKREHKSGKM